MDEMERKVATIQAMIWELKADQKKAAARLEERLGSHWAHPDQRIQKLRVGFPP